MFPVVRERLGSFYLKVAEFGFTLSALQTKSPKFRYRTDYWAVFIYAYLCGHLFTLHYHISSFVTDKSFHAAEIIACNDYMKYASDWPIGEFRTNLIVKLKGQGSRAEVFPFIQRMSFQRFQLVAQIDNELLFRHIVLWLWFNWFCCTKVAWYHQKLPGSDISLHFTFEVVDRSENSVFFISCGWLASRLWKLIFLKRESMIVAIAISDTHSVVPKRFFHLVQ